MGRVGQVGQVSLARALSKLRILSRARAAEAIRAGRVRVDGRTVRDPSLLVTPERACIELDGTTPSKPAWRTIVFHKPRGVVTTARDPEGRPTVFDVLGEDGRGLVAVGRLDRATTGLLILTTDTQLANRLADPRHGVSRVYVATVRGALTRDQAAAMERGIVAGGEQLRAESVVIRKASKRETHLVVELKEGRNREIRRLCEAVGHEVTGLKRVRFGGLEIGDLEPGQWRDLTRREVNEAFD